MENKNTAYALVNPRKSTEIEEKLDPLVKKWFFSKFKDFSLTQRYGVMPIFERKNILISAPTGGTKTLTAFLSILNYLVQLSLRKELENKIYAVYVSPLKSLVNDIEVNLKKPLDEIEELHGTKLDIRVSLRTGDTENREKTKMLKASPHILITTPESLAIMLNSPKFSEKFNMTEFVILDEIHSLAENKRGTHLSLTLERLQNRSNFPFSRIGLSATVAPLNQVANYLVGEDRDCVIADVQLEKQTELEILSPVKNFLETESIELNTKLYSLLDNLIEKNKTTLIFTNTRAATERVVHNLREKFPGKYIENIGAHHSSLSKEHRFEIERKLREGKLKCVVCSTSLELGIDIGFIDLVILLGSPKSVSRAMQRIGRAGHKLHEIARGKFVVYDFDELVECSIIQKNSKERIIDTIHIPENCLDVLSQHVYGMAIEKVWAINEMYELIKKSYPYRNLSKEDFFSVISYLSGEYELNVNNLYSKIWYDPHNNQIGKRGKLARVIYMTNIGTIPDESFISVVDKNGGDIGKIDEIFLEKIRKGDVFVLGGKKYQFMYSKGMKAYVIPSDRMPTIPSWVSESLPLSYAAACSIGKFRRLIEEKLKLKKSPEEIAGFISSYTYNSKETSKIILTYLSKQYKHSVIPHDKRILIEEFKNPENKKNYVIFHSIFGRRVNDCLSRAIAYVVSSARKHDAEIGINDNGFFIAGKDLDADKLKKGLEKILEDPKNITKILNEAIDKTEVLKRRFRHCAARSLMILRNYKGNRKTVGKQQMSSHFILSAILKKTKDFPILKEARREVLEDLMDIVTAQKIIEKIKNKEIVLDKKNTKIISPFAINLILQAHTDKIKIEEKSEFIKRVWAELENG